MRTPGFQESCVIHKQRMHILFNLCDKTPGLALIGPGTPQILLQV